MASKEECTNCSSYNPNSGLCTKKWIIPEWDGQKCGFANDKEHSDEVSTARLLNTHIDKTENVNYVAAQEDRQQQMQRHGCVTFWLCVALISNSGLLIYYLSKLFTNEEPIESCISIVLGVIVVVSLILMFRWNKFGVYIFVAIQLFFAIFFLIAGEYSSLNSCIFPLAIMGYIFRLKAKDNKTYFENVGIQK